MDSNDYLRIFTNLANLLANRIGKMPVDDDAYFSKTEDYISDENIPLVRKSVPVHRMFNVKLSIQNA